MRLTDSHAHLTDDRLLGQVGQVVSRARAAGVCAMVTVGCGPEDGQRAVELAARFEDVWAAVAAHPHDAADFTPEMLARVESLLARPKVVALGEIGLDYHYDFAPRDAQRIAFEAQLRLAGRLGLPVIIHSRDSVADALAVIGRVRGEIGPPGESRPDRREPLGGVFHCFTGTAAEARAVVEAGFYVSMSGAVTFKKSQAIQAAAKVVPSDRLLIETDAPYLAPEPVRRQKVNEPALLVHTLRFLADLRGQDPDALAEQTTRNAAALFGL